MSLWSSAFSAGEWPVKSIQHDLWPLPGITHEIIRVISDWKTIPEIHVDSFEHPKSKLRQETRFQTSQSTDCVYNRALLLLKWCHEAPPRRELNHTNRRITITVNDEYSGDVILLFQISHNESVCRNTVGDNKKYLELGCETKISAANLTIVGAVSRVTTVGAVSRVTGAVTACCRPDTRQNYARHTTFSIDWLLSWFGGFYLDS